MAEKKYDVAVIGGGPAGMTAALYAARAGKTCLVIEKNAVGGQIVNTSGIDNFPAAPGIKGFDYAIKLQKQAESFGAEFIFDDVKSVKEPVSEGKAFDIEGSVGNYKATAIVLATGLDNRKMGIENEDRLIGHGISFCALCDGAFFRGADVAVYGGGNTALEDAEVLASICNTVTVIHRRDRFRGEQTLVDSLKNYDNVKYEMNHTISAVTGDGMLEGVIIKNTENGEEREIKVKGLFEAIGRIPNGKAFANLVIEDDRGYYEVDENCESDSVPGVFVAGDGRSKKVRQLTTAVGDGAVAGTAASKYVDRMNGREYI